MRVALRLLVLSLPLALPAAPAFAEETGGDARRMVLVELFTSQGCDMCPAAEEVLGELASKDRRVVPVAFHVDYFNEPWHDVFSDPLYSRRQATYNELYKGPRNSEYGLYYTPMLMVDGVETVNGRDPAGAEAAVRRALARKPAVALGLALDLKADGRSGELALTVTSRSPKAEKGGLLACAVLREDGVVTEVASGENRGKTLVARFPARQTKYDVLELKGGRPATARFAFTPEPNWDPSRLRLAVFVQDRKTVAVYQAADLPWRATGKPAARASR